MNPTLPSSWSSLTWQQLCHMWVLKLRYGGEPDVAICAAWLWFRGFDIVGRAGNDPRSGEDTYLFTSKDGQRYTINPRQLSRLAARELPWFHYPYGDPGQEEKRDKAGHITQEYREAHIGYVGPLRDALMLPYETITVRGKRVSPNPHSYLRTPNSKVFALPQVACTNLTWQQYRALQAITPRLWDDNLTDEETIALQTQFLANILVPRSVALLDKGGDTIRLRPHFTFKYSNERADRLVDYWKKKLLTMSDDIATLFHVCHQVWQTALGYYSKAYPLLFNSDDGGGPMRDALQGEVGTVNTVMKYAGYSEQQQVYDSNLPFVLDILNTMTKEAKELESIRNK